MLGTRRVSLVTQDQDPYDVLVEVYQYSDSNKRTSVMRANQLFARAGANRQVVTPGGSTELAKRSDILDYVDVSKPYISRICGIISRLTSPFKRKCTVGFFMANGTTLRYPDEFKLDVSSDDQVRNVENEEINKLIEGFKDQLYNNLYDANNKFNAYMENNFPKDVQLELTTKTGDYWVETTTGNVYRAVDKAFRSRGLPFSEQDKENFKEVFLNFRAAAKAMSEPSYDLVSKYLGIDKKTLYQTACDAIAPIIAAAPDKILKNLVNGE